MFRFKTLEEYDNALDQLTEEIAMFKDQHVDPQTIVDRENVKLSYIVEKKEFIQTNYDN